MSGCRPNNHHPSCPIKVGGSWLRWLEIHVLSRYPTYPVDFDLGPNLKPHANRNDWLLTCFIRFLDDIQKLQPQWVRWLTMTWTLASYLHHVSSIRKPKQTQPQSETILHWTHLRPCRLFQVFMFMWMFLNHVSNNLKRRLTKPKKSQIRKPHPPATWECRITVEIATMCQNHKLIFYDECWTLLICHFAKKQINWYLIASSSSNYPQNEQKYRLELPKINSQRPCQACSWWSQTRRLTCEISLQNSLASIILQELCCSRECTLPVEAEAVCIFLSLH